MAPVMASDVRVLSFIGGAFLLWCAARKLTRRRSLVDNPSNMVSLSSVMAYGSAVAFKASNPTSPLLMVALLSPIIGLSVLIVERGSRLAARHVHCGRNLVGLPQRRHYIATVAS